jgi:hypothetical protein
MTAQAAARRRRGGRGRPKPVRYCLHGVPVSEPGRRCIHACT